MPSSRPLNRAQYAQTKIFSEPTMPDALRHDHSTSAYSQGRITVHKDLLIYTRKGHPPERLTPEHPGTMFPDQLHDVQPDGPVMFSIAFFHAAKAVSS